MHHGPELTVVLVVTLTLVLGALARGVSQRLNFPYTILMLLIGAATGAALRASAAGGETLAHLHQHPISSDLVIFVFLPHHDGLMDAGPLETLRDVTIRSAPREPVGPLVVTLLAIDDDASALYARGGHTIDLPHEHPFVQAELARWAACAREGRVVLAEVDDQAVGFAAYAYVDGLAYLDQLAVRSAFMRRGIGRALVDAVVAAVQAEGASALWLTTYAHLPWNGPYYGALGFTRVDEQACGPELRALLTEQREALPAPEQRIAMVRTLHPPGGAANRTARTPGAA